MSLAVFEHFWVCGAFKSCKCVTIYRMAKSAEKKKLYIQIKE